MSRQSPYEHEQVEEFDRLANLEVCANMEITLQPDHTQQIESAPQHSLDTENFSEVDY
jgi:hypothetical protein